MKHCVLHNLRFETQAQRDKFDEEVRLKISGRPVWGETALVKGEGEGFTHSLAVWFENELDMNEVFGFIRGEMERIPEIRGKVSRHCCSHDENPQPCVVEEEFSK